jgi:type I restriction enzyme S subunit
MFSIVSKEDIAANRNHGLSGEKYKNGNVIENSEWEKVKLEEVLDYEQPTKYIVDSVDYDDSYITPVLTAGKTFILGKTNETDGIFNSNLPVIIFDDFTTATKYVDFPFKVKSSAMKILHAKKDKISIRYAYYAIQNLDFPINEHKRYWISEFSKLEIPLPPLDIQEQIIAELDGYAAIISGAKQIVENWKPSIDVDPEWEKEKLGDCVEIYNGSTPRKTDAAFWDNGTIPWFTIADVRNQGRFISSTTQKITKKALDETSVKLLPADTVLLCCTASIGEYAYAEIPLTTNQQFNGLVVKNQNHLNPRYLFLLVANFKSELERMSGKSTFGFVSVGTLKDFEISVPPMGIQNALVAKFEAERSQVESATSLMESYEARTQAVIAKLWSE